MWLPSMLAARAAACRPAGEGGAASAAPDWTARASRLVARVRVMAFMVCLLVGLVVPGCVPGEAYFARACPTTGDVKSGIIDQEYFGGGSSGDTHDALPGRGPGVQRRGAVRDQCGGGRGWSRPAASGARGRGGSALRTRVGAG